VGIVSLVQQRHSLTFRPRTYTAFAITPQPPIIDWLAELDASLQHAEKFFGGHAVALDLSAVNLSANGIGQLVSDLGDRNIRILGIEGVDPAQWQAGLPSILRGGRAIGPEMSEAFPPISIGPEPVTPTPQRQEPASLVVENPVRSGQSIVFIEGDVTVIGSVGSGAEIVAGGSIHVYGALRGRALAGATGNTRARIFCHRVEAELLAIDSYYRTADEIDDGLRRRPGQAWLDGDTLKISPMN
jgi:septum site-determining protein MinC